METIYILADLTGNILQVGMRPSAITSPTAVVTDYPNDFLENITAYTFLNNVFTKIAPPDPRTTFDADKCMEGLAQVFANETFSMQYLPVINRIELCARHLSFYSLNLYLNAWVSDGTILQTMADDVNSVFKQQDIDLTTAEPYVQ
jgi:hypothetical protein